MLASPDMKKWENAMRVSFLALGAGIILASMPVASDAQRADNDILPRSTQLQKQGEDAQAHAALGRLKHHRTALRHGATHDDVIEAQ